MNEEEELDLKSTIIPEKLLCYNECYPACKEENSPPNEEDSPDNPMEDLIENMFDCGLMCGSECMPEAFDSYTELFENVPYCYHLCQDILCPAYCNDGLQLSHSICKEACLFGCLLCDKPNNS